MPSVPAAPALVQQQAPASDLAASSSSSSSSSTSLSSTPSSTASLSLSKLSLSRTGSLDEFAAADPPRPESYDTLMAHRDPPPPLVLSNRHLRPGHRASILDFTVTLDLYRANAAKTQDPATQLEFARFLLLAAPQFPDQTARLRREALALTKKVAQNSDEARCVLAECLELGYAHKDGRADYPKAFQMYLQAAKKQYPEAAYRVGVYYEQGRGVVKSSPRAVQFYQKAAAAGHPGAMYRLGMAELHGDLGMPVNPRNAVKWLKHSASGATADHPLALFELAQLHEVGIEHVVFVDYAYALQLYMEAARLGHTPSMFRLGNYFEQANHVPADLKLAYEYYAAAAENGHAEAMFVLATAYLAGNEPAEIPQSDSLAFEWMQKSADLGFEKAVYAIGHFYEEGVGVPRDLSLANEWYEKAPKHPGLSISMSQDAQLVESFKRGDREKCRIM